MMAVGVVWCILLYVPFVFGQTQFIPYITKADCGQVTIGGQVFNQYFDPVKLECVPCKQEESFQIASSEGKSCMNMIEERYFYEIKIFTLI